MLYEVLGDVWVGATQPLSARRLAGQPQAPCAQLIDALHHRLGEVDKRRTLAATPARCPGGRVADCSRAAIDRFAKAFDQMGAIARTRHQGAGQGHQPDNIKFDGPSRVAHVTDATDWRVGTPSWC